MIPTTLPIVPRETSLEGRHVLYAMLAFFGVIFSVNGFMLYHALATHSGIVALEPYRKGLAYNERIAADERQLGLRWSADVAVSPQGAVTVTLSGIGGEPLVGRRIEATVGRAVSSRHDLRLRLVEEAPGRYVAVAGALEPGAWIVDAVVHDAADDAAPVYRMRRRLWLKP